MRRPDPPDRLINAQREAIRWALRLSPAEAVRAVQSHVREPWLREALHLAADQDVRVVGLRRLAGPDPRLPWPAVGVLVRRHAGGPGVRERWALVLVLRDTAGRVATRTRAPAGAEPPSLPPEWPA